MSNVGAGDGAHRRDDGIRSGYGRSLYADAAGPPPRFPRLDGPTTADVAIIGGGYTGLSAALHLAEAGVDTLLIEAAGIGDGASGRNGGQLHSGQRRDQDWLEAHLGRDDARRLWRLAQEAKALVKDLIDRRRIDCDWRDGLIEAVHRPRLLPAEKAYVDKLRNDYGYDAATWLERDALSAAIGTDVYYGGRRDSGAGHLDPLKLAYGLARAAAAAGARIHESSRATALRRGAQQIIETTQGTITADIVILAANGTLAGIEPETEARVMPIDNYILATGPVGAGRKGGFLAGGEAVSDSRYVVYYFRPSPDGRLIFGGGETYTRRPPPDMAGFVRRHLARVYPDLVDVRVDYAWGGTLAITVRRLPFVRRVRPGVYAAAGYSGQGIALAPFAGKVLAEAIAGAPGRLDAFAALPCPPFPGGRLLRGAALVAGMSWYALRDRL